MKVAAIDANKAAPGSMRGVPASAVAAAAPPAPSLPAKPAAATPVPAPATTAVAAASPAPAAAPSGGSSPLGFVGGVADSSKSLMNNLFAKVGVGGAPSPAMQVYEPQQPVAVNAPLPPKRSAAADTQVRMANAKPDDGKSAAATQ